MKQPIVCLFFSLLFGLTTTKAQTDTLFWFAVPDITAGHEQSPNVFKICTYNRPATVIISQPANPFFQSVTFQLAANSSQIIDITNRISLIENTLTNTVENKGIKISATASITCYYEVGIRNNPEIFVLKGRSAFGKKFLIPAQTRFQNFGYVPLQKKGFIVTAFENGTVVTITPKNSVQGHAAGIPFIIRLNAGETYTINALDGQAVNHVGGCEVVAEKDICITTYEDSVQSSPCADLIGDQIIPESKAGLEYILVRGEYVASTTNAIPQDFFYVYPTQNSTSIFVNGTLVATANRGNSYEGIVTANVAYITADKPVLVMQVSGFGCEFTGTTLPNIACTGSQNISFIRSTAEPFTLNLLCKTTEINHFQINGVSNLINPNLFIDVPGTNGVWKAARLKSTEASTAFLNSFIIEGAATNITNTNGVFHVGFINGDIRTGGRLGYFSNYTVGSVEPQITSAQCVGNNIQLQSNRIANASYNWTGPNSFVSNSSNPLITNATLANKGTYYIATTVPGCGVFTDSIEVDIHYKPTIQLLKDTSICLFDTAQLTISLNGKAPFTFNYGTRTFTNITDTTLLVEESPNTTTTYQVTALTDAEGCTAINPNRTDILQATITVLPAPSATIIGLDTMDAGESQTIQFLFTGQPPFNLLYSTNNRLVSVNNINNTSYSLSISPLENTLYKVVNVSDASTCNAGLLDSLLVKVGFKLPKIPNAFSPNGDGINDTWILSFMEAYPMAEITIFNRYGQLVHTIRNYTKAKSWNGTFNGKPLPLGTYYYTIDLKNKTPLLGGSITIIR